MAPWIIGTVAEDTDIPWFLSSGSLLSKCVLLYTPDLNVCTFVHTYKDRGRTYSLFNML